MLDSLAVFFDPGSSFVSKVRRSVFIFLYEGEEPVVDWALEMYEKDQERDQIGIKEAEKVIWNFILNDQEGGMEDSKAGVLSWSLHIYYTLHINYISPLLNNIIFSSCFHHFQLIKKGLIQHHLPFLPLQRKHVRNCIQKSIEVNKKNQNMSSFID